MSQINALIAGVGGPQPPAWDYNEAKTAGLRNRLLEQQVEAQPFKPALDEQSMKIREESLKLREIALSQSVKENISVDYPEFTVSGNPNKIAEVAGVVAQFPDQAKGPEFLSWVASKGVSFKQREAKAPVLGTPEWEAAKRKEADITASTNAKYREPKEPKEPDMNTIYGPDGQTKRVPIIKGKEYIPPTGWSLKAPDKESAGYTPQQKVDDTRQYYSMKMKSLLDPMGIGIREGKEGEYNILMQELADDINAVQAGKIPKYLKTPEGKTMTDDIARDYIKKANGDKEKARALAKADGYKF